VLVKKNSAGNNDQQTHLDSLLDLSDRPQTQSVRATCRVIRITTSKVSPHQSFRAADTQILNRIFDIEMRNFYTGVADLGIIEIDGECFDKAIDGRQAERSECHEKV